MSRQPHREAWMIDWLNTELAINLGLAIDHLTHESYSSALNLYITFCCLHNFDIEPMQCTLAYYVTSQSLHIDLKSVDSYLSGICNQLKSHFPEVWNVMTQLCEVEVCELRPKYLVKVTKYEFYYLSRTLEAMIYHSRTLSDQRSKLYEGQESTYSGSEDLWRRVLTMSQLETVRMKDEGISQ